MQQFDSRTADYAPELPFEVTTSRVRAVSAPFIETHLDVAKIGMVAVRELTKDNISTAIDRLVEQGFFDTLAPIGTST